MSGARTRRQDAGTGRRGPALWNTHALPQDQSKNADACLVLNAAAGLAAQLDRVPNAKNQAEARLHLDRAVMVALGGFHEKAE